jgi:plastocyanin
MAGRFRSLPLTAALSVAVLPLPLHLQHQAKPSGSNDRAERRTGHAHEGRAPQRQADGAPVAAAPASLVVDPAAPQSGQEIRLTVTGGPAGATDYRWDLTGTGVYAVDSGAAPATTGSFATPGPRRVGIEIQTPSGEQVAAVVVNVAPAPNTGAASGGGTGSAAEATTTTTTTPTTKAATTPGPGAKPPPRPHTRPNRDGAETRTRHQRAQPSARTTPRHELGASHTTHVALAAGDPGVGIADFHFTPGTTTIHVGDTITWTNNGPSPHSATANNHSFDTGVLKKGQSGSHTFTQAGTFTYFCSVHPFMHGTIVVQASTQPSGSQSSGSTSGSTGGSQGSGTTPGSGAASGSPPTSAAAPTVSDTQSTTASGAILPTTGLDVLSVVGTGLGLLGVGLVVRRRLRAN